MKKTIGVITIVIFGVCAFFTLTLGVNAETYKISDGKSLSFTNAPTTTSGSSTNLVTVKNSRKSATKASRVSTAQSATTTVTKSANQEASQENTNAQEATQTDENTNTQDGEYGDNGDNTKVDIVDAPI